MSILSYRVMHQCQHFSIESSVNRFKAYESMKGGALNIKIASGSEQHEVLLFGSI